MKSRIARIAVFPLQVLFYIGCLVALAVVGVLLVITRIIFALRSRPVRSSRSPALRLQ